MLMFDASNRDQCEVKRARTNTPLQALVMLNDPHVSEASRVSAERLLQEKLSIDEKIQKAFRSIICRRASSEELAILSEYFQEEAAYFATEKEAARQLIEVGETPHLEWENKAELAALMRTIHTIYNMEEAITKS